MHFPTDFSLLLVLGAPKLGVRAATGSALGLGWLQAALGSVESRALNSSREKSGVVWEAGARQPERWVLRVFVPSPHYTCSAGP